MHEPASTLLWQGRMDNEESPEAVSRLPQLMTNLPWDCHTTIDDAAHAVCIDNNLEAIQHALTFKIKKRLDAKLYPYVLGGRHEDAYGDSPTRIDWLFQPITHSEILSLSALADYNPNYAQDAHTAPLVASLAVQIIQSMEASL